jgi:hypothetical protein
MSESLPLVSMSQRLVEFGGPDLPSTTDERAYSAHIHIVITAWNLAVVPGNSKISRKFDDALLASPPHVRRVFEVKLAELVDRKKRLFPDDTRVVADARLIKKGETITLETKSYDYAIHGEKGL